MFPQCGHVGSTSAVLNIVAVLGSVALWILVIPAPSVVHHQTVVWIGEMDGARVVIGWRVQTSNGVVIVHRHGYVGGEKAFGLQIGVLHQGPQVGVLHGVEEGRYRSTMVVLTVHVLGQ